MAYFTSFLKRHISRLHPDTATICPRHGDELQEEWVPILYGLVRWPDDFLEAHREQGNSPTR